MNCIQNQINTFKFSNFTKVLGGMIALGALMFAMGVHDSLSIWLPSFIAVVIVAKVLDLYSAKQEVVAQAEQSAVQQANITSLADHRNLKVKMEVAA